MKQWHAVHVQSNAESRAEHHLRNQGFEVFLPKYRCQRKHARKVEQVLRPLFPRYLFVSLDPDQQRWRSINGTIGVLRLLSSGNEPLPVPPEIIQHIMDNRDESGIVVFNKKGFKHGERLGVAVGAFAEFEGFFEEMDGNERVVLLLDFMGRKVRAKVPISSLAVAV